jgi:hypothetical protein
MGLGMSVHRRLLAVGLVSVAVLVWAVSLSGGGSAGVGSSVVLSEDALGGSLASGGDLLRSSPDGALASGVARSGVGAGRSQTASAAVGARSQTQLAHLSAARAARVDREAFPAQVGREAGGPPSLPRGQRIVRFLSGHAAQIVLGHGKGAVVESMQPMAVETLPGHRAPVNLGLTRTGGVFESVRPVVGVLIPARARQGVQLPQAGVSLTPVDARGVPLGGGEGAIDGASVVYANTQSDADTIIKPTVAGVETTTVLRSADSPTILYFRVGLPAGARLLQSRGGVGPVQVVDGAHKVAVVRRPNAVDAAGATVPVSMSVQGGDLLVISVSVRGGGYEWPVAVDPEVSVIEDESLGPVECHQKGEAERESSNWCFHAGGNFASSWRIGEVALYNTTTVGAGEYAVEAYHTQGDSKIYKLETITSGEVLGEARLELARPRLEEKGEVEASTTIAKNEWWKRVRERRMFQ